MKPARTYRKVSEAYDWSRFLEQAEEFGEFISQKELTENRWPVQRVQLLIKPFQIGHYLVYNTQELKEAIRKEMENPDLFVLHPNYIDLNEISTLMGYPTFKVEQILNQVKQEAYFVHPTLPNLRIYDRQKFTAWYETNKYHIRKLFHRKTGLSFANTHSHQSQMADDVQKYSFSGPRAAAYLGQTQAWLSNNRQEPLHRRIPFLRLGKLYRYSQTDLDFYIRNNLGGGIGIPPKQYS